MSRFPFFKEVSGVRALVVGGGSVALRRAKALAQSGAEVLCVAPDFCEGFEALNCIMRGFRESDLEDVCVVVAATDDHALNSRIAALCRDSGIEVNAADNPEASTFSFPAIIRRGGMTAAVSSDGISPSASKYIRERIERVIPEDFDEVLSRMETARIRVKALENDPKRRSAVLRRIFDALMSGEEMSESLIRQFMEEQMIDKRM
jgi:siroheme synthase-like protein